MPYESDAQTIPPGAPDDTLLVTYLLGTCSQQERDDIGTWVAASDDAAVWMARTSAAWHAAKRERPHVSEGVVLARVRARIASAGPMHTTPDDRPMPRETRPVFIGMMRGARSPRRWMWYSLAAILLGVAGLTRGWTSVVQSIMGHRSTVTTSYVTTDGQRKTMTLVDGTTVILDVASRLDVAADYDDGHRVVHLSGRALFTVSHHAGTPFTVQTSAATTRVLGTAFMVRHYPTDTTTKVAVREGRVVVNDVVITPARMIEVSQGGAVRVRPIDASPFMFAIGILALDSMRLADAIPELDRWYNVDIRLGDPALGQRLIEGRFPTHAQSDLTEVLEWMFDATALRNGRILTLFPRAER